MRRPPYHPVPLPEGFEAALDRRPGDWVLRAVVADWLDENGDPLAAGCMRWQAASRKRPEQAKWFADGRSWLWCTLRSNGLGSGPYGRVLLSNIPEPLVARMPADPAGPIDARAFPTRAAADLALRTAWGRLTDRQRDRVLAWPPKLRQLDLCSSWGGGQAR